MLLSMWVLCPLLCSSAPGSSSAAGLPKDGRHKVKSRNFTFFGGGVILSGCLWQGTQWVSPGGGQMCQSATSRGAGASLVP